MEKHNRYLLNVWGHLRCIWPYPITSICWFWEHTKCPDMYYFWPPIAANPTPIRKSGGNNSLSLGDVLWMKWHSWQMKTGKQSRICLTIFEKEKILGSLSWTPIELQFQFEVLPMVKVGMKKGPPLPLTTNHNYIQEHNLEYFPLFSTN